MVEFSNVAKRTHSKGSSEHRERAAKRDAALQNDFAAALQIADESDRARALISLAPKLPTALMPETLDAIEAISNPHLCLEALIAIGPQVDSKLVPRALQIATRITRSTTEPEMPATETARASIIAALAPKVDDDSLFIALNAALHIADKKARTYALIALIRENPKLFHNAVFDEYYFSDEHKGFALGAFREYFNNYGKYGSKCSAKEFSEIFNIVKKTRRDISNNKKVITLGHVTKEESREKKKGGDTGRPFDKAVKLGILSARLETYETNVFTTTEFEEKKKDEGDVLHSDKNKTELWNAVLEAENVPESQREQLITQLRIEIARATRPKWAGRLQRGGELATLTAPQFLKRVHADDISPDGEVRTEIIRAIDPELMKIVEQYIFKRKSRNLDLGDAEGLKIVLHRRPRTRAARQEISSPR